MTRGYPNSRVAQVTVIKEIDDVFGAQISAVHLIKGDESGAPRVRLWNLKTGGGFFGFVELYEGVDEGMFQSAFEGFLFLQRFEDRGDGAGVVEAAEGFGGGAADLKAGVGE